MPWNPAQASQHKQGLSPKQKKQWAEVANSALKRTGDEASAIRQANAVTGRKAAVARRLTRKKN